MKLSGTANLPLHGGKAPPWLFRRMVELAKVTSEALVFEFGCDEFLRRLSNPYWFQSYSCVLGFDWHSSGTTTVTCGALKEALSGIDIGVVAAGGKGKVSKNTPDEIIEAVDKFSIKDKKAEKLVYASRMSAKVDNSCVQDGYSLYHHSFFVTERGRWAVVQQGMNEERRYARRYHWHSCGLDNFVVEPHEGIAAMKKEDSVLDMTAKRSQGMQDVCVDIVKDKPWRIGKYFSSGGQKRLFECCEVNMPSHHPVIVGDISATGWKALRRAYEVQPRDYEELVSLSGMGPKTIRALALVANLVYGEEASWKDPAKYSFAHGGKDGFPYPVDVKLMEKSADAIKGAIEDAEFGNKEKILALKRLGRFC
ncbi:MAG: DUF763 domain-containing protein [archaeon]|nr:DUF763 domain-containing protein [archaeon]